MPLCKKKEQINEDNDTVDATRLDEDTLTPWEPTTSQPSFLGLITHMFWGVFKPAFVYGFQVLSMLVSGRVS